MKGGRVAFNQVVMEQQEPPAGVMLVAIDPDRGLYLWLRPHDLVDEPATIAQAPGYSRTLPPFLVDEPPPYLGPPVFVAKQKIAMWDEIIGKATNSLNRAIRDLLGIGD
jgi:hypothetical protein